MALSRAPMRTALLSFSLLAVVAGAVHAGTILSDDFNYSDGNLSQVSGGLWNPRLPELSHTLNAFQLALPYLEPYFIDAVREGAELVSDPPLKADALAFCAQEANHSRQPKRYCRRSIACRLRARTSSSR